MPKFHCIHCGQHIDAPEVMAGMNSKCPTCGGAIEVPGQPLQQPPPLPTMSAKKSNGGGISGIVSTAIFLIVCVTAGVAGKSCVRSVLPKRSSSNYSENASPPSTKSLTIQEVAGLRIKLPSKPIRENMNLPPEAAKLMKSFQMYKVDHAGSMIMISHMVYHISEVNLDGSADGSIAQVRSLPSVTNFSSTKSVTTVSGLQGRQISMSAKNGPHSIAAHGLVFARGSEAWQIQVMGTSTHGDEIKSLSDSIFSSIEVTN